MGKINVLSFAVANLIAAGEVVDLSINMRPLTQSLRPPLLDSGRQLGSDLHRTEIHRLTPYPTRFELL